MASLLTELYIVSAPQNDGIYSSELRGIVFKIILSVLQAIPSHFFHFSLIPLELNGHLSLKYHIKNSTTVQTNIKEN